MCAQRLLVCALHLHSRPSSQLRPLGFWSSVPFRGVGRCQASVSRQCVWFFPGSSFALCRSSVSFAVLDFEGGSAFLPDSSLCAEAVFPCPRVLRVRDSAGRPAAGRCSRDGAEQQGQVVCVPVSVPAERPGCYVRVSLLGLGLCQKQLTCEHPSSLREPFGGTRPG